jgi:hypothetical protein
MVAEIAGPANALYYLDPLGLRVKPHIVLLGTTLLKPSPAGTIDPKANRINSGAAFQ